MNLPFLTLFQCTFFRIADITKTILVGEGEPAHLECRVDANPLTDDTITWKRLEPGYDMKSKTKTTRGLPGPGQTIEQLSENNGVKSVNTQLSKFGTSKTSPDGTNVGVLLLTVLNSTAEDSGPFWCVADNGIGNVEVKNATYLLVRRKLILNNVYHYQFILCPPRRSSWIKQIS